MSPAASLLLIVTALTGCKSRPLPRGAATGMAGADANVKAPPAHTDGLRDGGATIDGCTHEAASDFEGGSRPPAVVRYVPFESGRSAYVVLPRESSKPVRLLAMLHGVCVPPSYVCGDWKETAADVGLLVCPTGNTTCGPNGTGGPTWEEPFAAMDADLERSIEASRRSLTPRIDRRGAVLAGFSRGAYVAVILAVRHPGRWPYLLLNEADVELTVPMLTNAGVKAVALIAGEWGTQLSGERKTVEALAREGYPARLWVMPRVGHAYSSDIDRIMGDALEFLRDREPSMDAH